MHPCCIAGQLAGALGCSWRSSGLPQADVPLGLPPNPRMQPTGRSVPNSVRALPADGGQRNVGLCEPRLESPQLMRKSLDDTQAMG